MRSHSSSEEGSWVTGVRTTSRRLPFLDGARAAAALVVVAVHVRSTVASPNEDVPLPGFVLFFFDLGHYAVTVFIVISGFSLALGWQRLAGSAGWKWKFLVRRFWRIVPTYWASIALSVGLILTLLGQRTGSLWDVVLPLDWRGTGVHALLMQDILPGRAPNHVLWSIAVEWHIYFLFPLMLLLLMRRHASTYCVGLVTIFYALWAAGVSQWFSGLTIQYFACFALGVQAALWSASEAGARRLWTMLSMGTTAAVIFGIALYLLPGRLPAMNALADLPLAVFAGSALGLMRLGRLHLASRMLSWEPLAGMGLFAYSIYLIHAPLLQAIWQYSIRPWGMGRLAQFGLLIIPGVPLALLGCYGFFLLAERPFLTGRRPSFSLVPRAAWAKITSAFGTSVSGQ